jgi:hypothetical protein
VIIDDQEEALGAGVVYWVERETKVFVELNHTNEVAVISFLPVGR